MSHDQNFKNLILDCPRAALQFFAAEEVAGIDPDVRIIPVRQEQLKERLGERFRELDTPLLAEWPDGRREANGVQALACVRKSMHSPLRRIRGRTAARSRLRSQAAPGNEERQRDSQPASRHAAPAA